MCLEEQVIKQIYKSFISSIISTKVSRQYRRCVKISAKLGWNYTNVNTYDYVKCSFKVETLFFL